MVQTPIPYYSVTSRPTTLVVRSDAMGDHAWLSVRLSVCLSVSSRGDDLSDILSADSTRSTRRQSGLEDGRPSDSARPAR